MVSLIPESKDVFLNKLNNEINFNYDKITKTVSKKPTALVVGWIETPLFDIIL